MAYSRDTTAANSDVAILEALEYLIQNGFGDSPTGLTFSTVKITETVAGIADLGVVANATDVIRLHGLFVTARAQCTVTVGYDDDGAGTNAVTLTGPQTVGAGGSPHIGPQDKDGRGKLVTVAHATPKHMTVTFATAGGDGWAVISKGPA